jgi:hypothetical protein
MCGRRTSKGWLAILSRRRYVQLTYQRQVLHWLACRRQCACGDTRQPCSMRQDQSFAMWNESNGLASAAAACLLPSCVQLLPTPPKPPKPAKEPKEVRVRGVFSATFYVALDTVLTEPQGAESHSLNLPCRVEAASQAACTSSAYSANKPCSSSSS